MKTKFTATAVWLRSNGDHAEVLVEIDGQWKIAIREFIGEKECAFGHIAEGDGAHRWKNDDLSPVNNKS